MDLTKFSVRRWIYLVVSSLIIGCNSDDTPTISNYMVVEIDGKEFTYANDNLSVNENCDLIFINSATVQVDDQRFRLGFRLTKSGRISEIYCVDFSISGVAAPEFRSADFLSSEVFAINNFEFSAAEGTLSFDFDGLLFELDNIESSKRISGRVETNELELTDCLINPWRIAANIDQKPFESVEVEGSTTTTTDANDQIISIESSWFGISDNGFRISIITDAELEDMAPGTYSFSEKDLINVIKLEKYEGAHEAVQIEKRSGAWQNFECEGELVIDAQITGGIEPITKGRFSLRASKDSQVLYSITNGTFSI